MGGFGVGEVDDGDEAGVYESEEEVGSPTDYNEGERMVS